MAKPQDGTYSDAEAARRRDAIIKNMIATPPQKQKPLSARRKPRRDKAAGSKSG